MISKILRHVNLRRLQIKEVVWLARSLVIARTYPSKIYTDFGGEFERTCNPSLVRKGAGWLIALRQANYELKPGGIYSLSQNDCELHSRTIMLDCNGSFNVENHITVDDVDFTSNDLASHGLEDPRIFYHEGELHALWSAMHMGHQANDSSWSGEQDQGDFRFKPDWSETTNTMVLGKIASGCASDPVFLASPHNMMREKNWMPFTHKGAIHLLYRLENMEVYKVVEKRLELVNRREAIYRELRGWSGSSQLIEWNGGWLCVAHYAGRSLKRTLKSSGPFYFHRFVEISRDWKVRRVSSPFFIEKRGIEFCAGVASHDGMILLSYGKDDKYSAVLEIGFEYVENMLGSEK